LLDNEHKRRGTGTRSRDSGLFLSCLYKLSERQTELFANDSLTARCFVGLAATEPVPGHSTLSVFRTHLAQKRGATVFERLLLLLVRSASGASTPPRAPAKAAAA